MPETKKTLAEGKEKMVRWIESLRKAGVKAAHHDNDLVDSATDEIHFSYPYFYDDPWIGDFIALGNPDKFRLVQIVSIRRAIYGLAYFRFEPTEKVVFDDRADKRISKIVYPEIACGIPAAQL